ncbi:MAG: hypothetical protein IT304_03775 [Dehalococcoidia bacterium]|nr:hypothetical protein [Dehalococcoidia bacterium]
MTESGYWRAAAVLLVLAALALAACDADKKPPATVSPTNMPTATASAPATPTAAPPGSLIADCPVDREICDFALRAEALVRAGDAAALAKGGPLDTAEGVAALRDSLARQLPAVARAPYLASVGCPVSDAAACSPSFGLTFTTLLPMERAQPGDERGVLVLTFARSSGPTAVLVKATEVLGDDGVLAVATGGRSSGCGLSSPSGSGCVPTDFRLVRVERPVIAGQPPTCPVLAAICAYALDVERRLTAGDAAGVSGPGEAGTKLAADLRAVFGAGTPRLVAIGCPFGASTVYCDGPFALAFTTLGKDDDWTVGGRRLAALQFAGPVATARYTGLLALDDPDSREAAITGGIATKPCGIAGAAADGAQPCSAAYFEPYWSMERFLATAPVTAVVARTPAAAPPAGSTLFTAAGRCWACDEPDVALQKHVVDRAGRLTTTTVLESRKGILAGWTIGQLTSTADASLLAALVCDASYCGPMGSQKPEATWRAIWSTDGGATWTEVFRSRAEYAQIASVAAGRVAVMTSSADPGGVVAAYLVSAGGARRLTPPPDLPARWDVALLPGERVAWVPLSEDGLVVGGLRDESGERLALALPPGAAYPRFGMLPDGRVWGVWYQQGQRAGVFGPAGELAAVYALGDLSFAALTSARAGFGTVTRTGADGAVPALLDLDALTVTPLGDPFGSPSLPARARPLAIARQ